MLAARREDRLQELAAEIQSAGGQALIAPADVRRQADIDQMVGQALEEWGRVDLLFNNAGVSYDRSLVGMPPAQVKEELEVNLIAVVACTQAVLKPMLKQRLGHIINVASIAGLIGLPGASVYNATKFGMIGFSEGLDREVGRYGVRVSAFCPFFVATALIPRLNGDQAAPPGKLRIPGILKIEFVAERAVWLAAHPRRRYIIPRYFNVIVWAARTFPWGTDWLLNRFI